MITTIQRKNSFCQDLVKGVTTQFMGINGDMSDMLEYDSMNRVITIKNYVHSDEIVGRSVQITFNSASEVGLTALGFAQAKDLPAYTDGSVALDCKKIGVFFNIVLKQAQFLANSYGVSIVSN